MCTVFGWQFKYLFQFCLTCQNQQTWIKRTQKVKSTKQVNLSCWPIFKIFYCGFQYIYEEAFWNFGALVYQSSSHEINTRVRGAVPGLSSECPLLPALQTWEPHAVRGAACVGGWALGTCATLAIPCLSCRRGPRGQWCETLSFCNYGHRKLVKIVSYPKTCNNFHIIIWNQPKFLFLVYIQL